MKMISTTKSRFQEIVKEDSVSRLLVLIFLGSVLQSIVVFMTFFPNIVDFANGKTTSLEPITNFALFLIVNIIVIFGYCFITSISFTPKRIVHPLYVQMVACGIIIIMSAIRFVPTGTTEEEIVFGIRLAFVIILYFAVLAVLSWLVAKGLKSLIGISGDKNSLEKNSLFIPISEQRIKEILTNNKFCNFWGFEIKNESNEIILQTKSSADVQIRIIATPFELEKIKGYVIALVGYQIQYDSIIQGNSIETLNRIKRDIIDKLEGNEKNIDENIEQNDSLDSATELALHSTKPIIKKTSKSQIIIISVLATAVIGMLYPLNEGIIDFNSYVTFVGTIIASVALSIIPMRNKRSKT